FARKERFTPRGGFRVKTIERRLWGRDRELIELQCSQLWGYQIIFAADIAQTRRCRNRELFWVIESRVVECPLTVHLKVCHKSVPVCDRSPACPGVQVHAQHPKCRGDERCPRFSIRAHRLSIEDEFSIKLAWPPTVQNGSHGCIIHAQQVCER